MTTLLKEKPVETIEQAVQLANEIERLEAVLKSMREELKYFVDKNGAVETSDKVWDYSNSISWSFGSEQLKTMSQDMVLEGINAWDILSISSTGLKKLDWDDNILAKYGKKKATKRFSSHKK